MLNFILAPLGILLIGLGAVGLFLALRKRRRHTEPELLEPDHGAQSDRRD
jgi:hypothetical protein